MTDDDKARKRAELGAITRNRGRFGFETDTARDLYRVVDLTTQPPTPLTDWMDRTTAMALRDDYNAGRRTR